MKTWRTLTRLCYFFLSHYSSKSNIAKTLRIFDQILYLRNPKSLKEFVQRLFNLHQQMYIRCKNKFVYICCKQIEVSCLQSLSTISLFHLWLSNRSLLGFPLSIEILMPACMSNRSLLELSLSRGSLLVGTLSIRSLLQVCLIKWKSLGRVIEQL